MMYLITSLRTPLSACNQYFCTAFKVVFLCIVVSSPLIAEVDIVTLDDFAIYSVNKQDLVVAKSGKNDRDNFLGFRMERPFCICSNIVLSIKKGNTDIERGDRLKGTMTIDMKKPYQTNFKVLNIFDNGNLLLAPRGFPSIRSSQLIKVKLDNGISESFFMKGIDEVMEQSKSMCESPYLYEEDETKSQDMKV